MSATETLDESRPPSPRIERSLRLGHPVVALGILVVGIGSMVVSTLPGVVAALTGAVTPEALDAPMPLPVLAASVLLMNGGFVLGSLAVAWLATRRARASLGFRAVPGATVLAGALGILGLVPLSGALVHLLRQAFPGFELGALDALDHITRAYPVWVLWPLLALLPGLGEEVFFRGLVQNAVGRGVKAILFSGVAFALFHIDPPHVVGVLPLGLFLAWLGDRTGSVWVPIAAHTMNNSLAVFASQVVGAEDVTGDAMPPITLVLGGLVWTALWVVALRRTLDQREPGLRV